MVVRVLLNFSVFLKILGRFSLNYKIIIWILAAVAPYSCQLQKRERVECNAVPLHDTKAHRGSGGVVPFIPNLGIR